MNWNITLTRINGKLFEVDARWINRLEARRDGGTDLNVAGKRVPCRESILEIASAINDRVKEAANR